MSSKDMTLTQLKHTSKTFDDTHTVAVKGFKDGHGGHKKPRNRIPQWFKDFYDNDYKPFQQAFIESQSKPPKYFTDFANQMLAFVKEQRKFNQFVLDQFKKHEWTK